MARKVVGIEQHGSWSDTEYLLERCKNFFHLGVLDKYGKMGVDALEITTPKKTGLTSRSWYYEVVAESKDKVVIRWNNSNIQNGVHVAVVLQLGHATKTGSWVEGRDYISPALQPIFEMIGQNALKEIRGTADE